MKKSFRKKATGLKKLGLIDYDLRYRLHWTQRRKIEKLSEQYNEVLKHPQQFITRHVGKKTAKDLKISGYETIKDIRNNKIRTIIPIASDAIKARIRKGNIEVKYDGFSEKWFIGKYPGEFEAQLRRLEVAQRKDPYNFQITGKVGDNQPFKHSRFVDVNTFRNYIKTWKLHFPSNVKGKKARTDYRNDLIQHLTVIQIDANFRQGKSRGKKTKKNRRN